MKYKYKKEENVIIIAFTSSASFYRFDLSNDQHILLLRYLCACITNAIDEYLENPGKGQYVVPLGDDDNTVIKEQDIEQITTDLAFIASLIQKESK